MSRLKNYAAVCWLSSMFLLLAGCGAIGHPVPVGSVPPTPPPTVTLSANPTSIASGQSSTLSVTAANSSTVVITDNQDSKSFSLPVSGGSQAVSPTATTIYTATATGANSQTATAQVTVTVVTLPTVAISANPTSITSGQSSTLTVTATNSNTVVITDNQDSKSYSLPVSGGSQAVGPTTTTIYTATATGANNQTVTAQVTVTVAPPSVTLLNHIVFLAQENRSFDHYFGALRGYWAQNGYPDQSFDGLPQFNPSSGTAPLFGPPPAIPGCDPSSPPPADCVFDTNNPVASYHLVTQCIENPSPSWDESHVDWNYGDQVGLYPATLNGFVWTAGHDARFQQPPYNDTNGIRAMGYYDGGDLNYYYFMASNFATSDRWFNPAMTRTQPNRQYLIAGTSQGRAYPPNTDSNDSALLTAPTIFQELQTAGITWKIYVDPDQSRCSGPPYDPACLVNLSTVSEFQFGQTIVSTYPQNIAPISQYFTDLQNGTLPQVAQIEPASDAGLDEHPSDLDSTPNDLQSGANFVSSLINGLMTSTSWKDSVFILTYDEFGGFYDHVSPQPAVSPDGIKPVDLIPGDPCTRITGPTCDFVYTGYRVPMIVVSPYTKKNYVSHTVADTTAILKLIEGRFNLPSLTKRDAAQMDMTEFFDFGNPPWTTPPSPPTQNTNGACYLNKLP